MSDSEDDKRAKLATIWPPDAATAAEAGHEPMSPMQAIRKYCIGCCVYQPSEVRLCVAIDCQLWPWRSGQHPYTAKKRSPQSVNSATEADSEESGDPADDSPPNVSAEKDPSQSGSLPKRGKP